MRQAGFRVGPMRSKKRITVAVAMAERCNATGNPNGIIIQGQQAAVQAIPVRTPWTRQSWFAVGPLAATE